MLRDQAGAVFSWLSRQAQQLQQQMMQQHHRQQQILLQQQQQQLLSPSSSSASLEQQQQQQQHQQQRRQQQQFAAGLLSCFNAWTRLGGLHDASHQQELWALVLLALTHLRQGPYSEVGMRHPHLSNQPSPHPAPAA